MATKTLVKNQYEQDQDRVKEMLGFYSGQFNEVYKVVCMNCKRVIAVEVAPLKADGVVLEKKGRTLYTHDNLCLSVRRREDSTPDNKPMYGYQCLCGNNTLLATVERGEVAERTILKNKQGVTVHDTGPIAATSPFERAKTQAAVREKQASGKPADYETNGNMERYETFKIERVK